MAMQNERKETSKRPTGCGSHTFIMWSQNFAPSARTRGVIGCNARAAMARLLLAPGEEVAGPWTSQKAAS